MSGRNTSQAYENIVVPAAGELTLAIPGEFIHCVACNLDAFDIRLDGGSMSHMRPGFTIRTPVQSSFQSITFVNRSVTEALTCFVVIGLGEITTQIGGSLSVFNRVGLQGQPLSDDGGSLAQVGQSALAMANYQFSVDGTLEIFSAVDNANGAVIRTAMFIITAGVGLFQFFTDGVNNPRILVGLPGTKDHATLDREIFLEPGRAFKFSGSDAAGTAQIYATWDLI